MPALAVSLNVNSSSAAAATLTTSSFAVTAGDPIVVKGARENNVGSGLQTPTDSQGNTYTLRNSSLVASHCQVWIWTAIAGSSGSMAVSVQDIVDAWYSITVEHWTSAALDASPATNSVETGTGTPSSTLTTTQDNSAVTWVNADWNANSPAGRVYDSTSATPVEDGLHDKSAGTFYVAYYAYQMAGSAGSQTFGLTSPGSQTWSMVGIEVLDVPGPGAPEDPDQAEPLVLWQ